MHGSTHLTARTSAGDLGRRSFSGHLSRILGPSSRRVCIVLGGTALLAVAASAMGPRPSCGCALPPVPNLMAFGAGVRFLAEGNYAVAGSAFDGLLHDQDSSEVYAEALYGRGLSKRAQGQALAADADMAAARKLQPRVAERFDLLSHVTQ